MEKGLNIKQEVDEVVFKSGFINGLISNSNDEVNYSLLRWSRFYNFSTFVKSK